MTGLHRDRVIPQKQNGIQENGQNLRSTSRRLYAILRKTRWFFVVGIGGILANSYTKVFLTKSVSDGSLKSACVPFLNCHACPTARFSCPVGMIQHFAATRQIPFFLAGFLGLVGASVGRTACGWLCPFGWLQDVLFKIRTRKFRLPKQLLPLKYLSLIVLAILLPFFTGTHWFSRLCPWGALEAGIPWVIWNPMDSDIGQPVIEPGMVGWLYAIKIVVLVGFLVLFVLIKRPFCRTACPLGAVYSLFNRFSLLKIRVKGTCAHCDLCRKVCPMDIRISDDPGSGECIRCLECTVCKNIRAQWGKTHER